MLRSGGVFLWRHAIRTRRALLLLPLLLASHSGGAFSEEELVFGVYPFAPPTELFEKFTPLVTYLSTALDRPIRIETTRDYQSHIRAVGENRRDIAYLGPVPYVRTVAAYGPKPILAQLEVNGMNTFRGVIVVRRDSELEALSDLAGKRFAFGDPESTMSHLVPRYMLLEAGIGVDELSGFEHLRNHRAVAMGVLAGMFDAGAVKASVLRQFEQRGMGVLAWTPPIATHVLVARSDLPEQTLRLFREALARLRQQAVGPALLRAIKPSATALRPGTDGDFDELRAILRALGEAGAIPR